MSNIENPSAIAHEAVAKLYAVAQSSMKIATLDECANPELTTIKLEYIPTGNAPAACLLTFRDGDENGSPCRVPLEKVATAITNGRPILPQLLQAMGFTDVADRAKDRGFAEICTLESAVVHGYRIFLRHDAAQQPSEDLGHVDTGPQGYALRITPPKTADDRKARWFGISKEAVAAAVASGESLFKHALLDDPSALRFLSSAIPEVERIVIAAGIGAAPKAPSRSL